MEVETNDVGIQTDLGINDLAEKQQRVMNLMKQAANIVGLNIENIEVENEYDDDNEDEFEDPELYQVQPSKTENERKIRLKEKIDVSKLKYIVSHPDDFQLGSRYINGKKIDKNGQLTLLKNYLEQVNGKGERLMNYYQLNKFGRYWTEGDMGIQNMSRKIRHTLCQNFMYDIDMKNAHPTLLSWYCHDNGINCTGLDAYIENREKPDLYELAKKSKNKKGTNYNIEGTAVNYVMCSLENKALMIVFDYLTEQGIEVGSLVFDGLMIYKNNVSIEQLSGILDGCSQKVKEIMRCNITFTNKAMDEEEALTATSKEIQALKKQVNVIEKVVAKSLPMTGGKMVGDIDMQGHSITNLPLSITANEPVTKGWYAKNWQDLVKNFTDRVNDLEKEIKGGRSRRELDAIAKEDKTLDSIKTTLENRLG
ncbi:unnamed protein product [Mytilus coruscus]|uniref:Uncharacterized protein n=1 Tax=Mytilus coruscus TaxID=42192 RepID=A0A6J8D7T7_MYTCO|nr:unnamed protein product [Mytilus coruscus]